MPSVLRRQAGVWLGSTCIWSSEEQSGTSQPLPQAVWDAKAKAGWLHPWLVLPCSACMRRFHAACVRCQTSTSTRATTAVHTSAAAARPALPCTAFGRSGCVGGHRPSSHSWGSSPSGAAGGDGAGEAEAGAMDSESSSSDAGDKGGGGELGGDDVPCAALCCICSCPSLQSMAFRSLLAFTPSGPSVAVSLSGPHRPCKCPT
jgi:hypothetical protein